MHLYLTLLLCSLWLVSSSLGDPKLGVVQKAGGYPTIPPPTDPGKKKTLCLRELSDAVEMACYGPRTRREVWCRGVFLVQYCHPDRELNMDKIVDRCCYGGGCDLYDLREYC